MNMDYCKWENTYRAFQQCIEGVATSDREVGYMERLFCSMAETLIDYEVIPGYDEDQLLEMVEAFDYRGRE